MCKASISETATKNFAELRELSRFTTNLKDQINETITKLFQNRRELPVMMKEKRSKKPMTFFSKTEIVTQRVVTKGSIIYIVHSFLS